MLTEDLPAVGLTAGTIGTVVHVFRMPDLAYEVEFTDQDGATVALVTVRAGQIGPAGPRSPCAPGSQEILDHARHGRAVISSSTRARPMPVVTTSSLQRVATT
jgi:hypothetical protein